MPVINSLSQGTSETKSVWFLAVEKTQGDLTISGIDSSQVYLANLQRSDYEILLRIAVE